MGLTADFDGDGKSDLVMIRPNDPKPGLLTWVIKYSSGIQPGHVQWGANSLHDQPLVGDFDGDGRTDFAVVRPDYPQHGQLTWAIHFSGGEPDAHVQWGQDGDTPDPGDFDGDGKTDFALFRESVFPSQWVVKYSSGRPFDHIALTNTSYNYNQGPVPGDFDGDHLSDLTALEATPDSATDTWRIRYSSSLASTSVTAGGQTSGFVVRGDFDGDGRSGTSYLALDGQSDGSAVYDWHDIAANGSVTSQTWGFRTAAGSDFNCRWDVPVAGDFDGDGRTDYAVVRPDDPVEGLWTWRIRYATGAVANPVQWGADKLGDYPLMGDISLVSLTDFNGNYEDWYHYCDPD